MLKNYIAGILALAGSGEDIPHSQQEINQIIIKQGFEKPEIIKKNYKSFLDIFQEFTQKDWYVQQNRTNHAKNEVNRLPNYNVEIPKVKESIKQKKKKNYCPKNGFYMNNMSNQYHGLKRGMQDIVTGKYHFNRTK